jgi:2-polyprenyl-3-methyl-5-hydroxy-6-metoxy-1,4-benzoquinol methylase/uncharacterized membrane protein YbhN (UPF0104 family)
LPALTVLIVLPGATATWYWFAKTGSIDVSRVNGVAVAAGGVVVALLTIATVGLRWLRWHYLVRRSGARLATRESALVYAATLPAILTPFSVGELIRAVLLGRRHPSLRLDIVAVWGLERASGFLVAAALVAVLLHDWALLPAAVGLWAIAVLGIGTWWKRRGSGNRLHAAALAGLLVVTCLAWVLPGVALWCGTSAFEPAPSLGAMLGDFAKNTLMGQLGGSPDGIGVTDSLRIASLRLQGFSPDHAALVTVLFRGCSTWFAVAAGAGVALLFLRRLMTILKPAQRAGHFDELAPAYAAELPRPLRERLVERKTALMRRWLDRAGTPPSACGLDFGCGQGWYACEMARCYRMAGVDLSEGQIREARVYATSAGSDVQFERIEGTALPHGDCVFDFVYAINVLHHVTDKAQRDTILGEIVRVLKPGGVLFLHEINTANAGFRLYMSYVYPLIRAIDEGTESWIHPQRLPLVEGARWETARDFFTFLPDFLPAFLIKRLEIVERWLEESFIGRWSAHYVARLIKDGGSNPNPCCPDDVAERY